MILPARWNGLLKRRSPPGAIGLEISLTQLHLAQLSKVGNELRLSAHCSIEHHSEPGTVWKTGKEFSELVQRSLKLGGFRGKAVVAALPALLTRVMPVSYQTTQGESDSESISRLVVERIGDDAESMVIDYVPVETLQRTGTKLALVALCREDTVTEFLDALRSAGLNTLALEIGPIAIQRLINSIMQDLPAQNTLIVNCGREKSYLTLMADSRLLADDEINFGEYGIIDSLCKSLEIDPQLAMQMMAETSLDPERPGESSAQADSANWISEIVYPEFEKLAKEIERGLVYANSESRGSRRSSVYLLGSIARWNGAGRLLQSIIGVPVSLAPSPLSLFGQESKDNAPELAVATGLALHSFTQGEFLKQARVA